jgi:hypothetical protein
LVRFLSSLPSVAGEEYRAAASVSKRWITGMELFSGAFGRNERSNLTWIRVRLKMSD